MLANMNILLHQLTLSQKMIADHLCSKATNSAPSQPTLQPQPPAQAQSRPIQGLPPQQQTSIIPGLRTDVSSITDFKALSPVEGMPESTIKAALNGEFVHLEHFLLNVYVSQDTNNEIQQIFDNEGNVTYKPKRSKRRINNLQNWLEAWSNYEKLMIEYHGMQLYDIMWRYRKYICDCDKKYNRHAVALYDIRHRCELSRKSVDFAGINIDLQSQLLDAAAVKAGAARCYRCKSFDHTVIECPFSAMAPPQKAAPKGKASSLPTSSQVCRNFNALKCVWSNCTRKHVCRQCGGDLPFDLCSKSGPCSKRDNPPQG